MTGRFELCLCVVAILVAWVAAAFGVSAGSWTHVDARDSAVNFAEFIPYPIDRLQRVGDDDGVSTEMAEFDEGNGVAVVNRLGGAGFDQGIVEMLEDERAFQSAVREQYPNRLLVYDPPAALIADDARSVGFYTVVDFDDMRCLYARAGFDFRPHAEAGDGGLDTVMRLSHCRKRDEFADFSDLLRQLKPVSDKKRYAAIAARAL